MNENNLRKRDVIEFFDDFARDYDGTRFGTVKQRINCRIATEVVSELAGKVEKKRVLDAGCGTGRFTDFFIRENSNVISVDTSKEMLNVLRMRNVGAEPMSADIFNLPFKDGSFDLIICSQVLTHLHEYEKPLTEFKRVLGNDGFIIIDIRNSLYFPNYIRNIFPKVKVDKDSRYKPHFINIFKIRKISEKMGLEVEEFRGTGLSVINKLTNKTNEKRISLEKNRSNSIFKYIAPTLIIKIRKKTDATTEVNKKGRSGDL